VAFYDIGIIQVECQGREVINRLKCGTFPNEMQIRFAKGNEIQPLCLDQPFRVSININYGMVDIETIY